MIRPGAGLPSGAAALEVARRRMVDEQLVARGIRDPRVLEAMARIPRERFVDPALRARAYGDHALPTAEGQTISQPYIVARMLELARLSIEHRVLEIGTGSGYQTALLAHLVERVFSIERKHALLREARQRLDELKISNVALRHGDGSLGWQEFAPYDRVLVAAAAPRVPEALMAQLGKRGIVVIPLGGTASQILEVWERGEDAAWVRSRHGECRFVPLVGRDAWEREDGASL
ncbi:MAG: protein-L-isoaspartate(D-aspartate) O-methyltransferase [Gaiellaceae bacterium]